MIKSILNEFLSTISREAFKFNDFKWLRCTNTGAAPFFRLYPNWGLYTKSTLICKQIRVLFCFYRASVLLNPLRRENVSYENGSADVKIPLKSVHIGL